MAVPERFYGTGRRKTSIARVWVRPGQGRIVVNRRPFEDYFPRETLRMIIAQPLQLTSTLGQLDVLVNVGGGGPTGQAGAGPPRSPPPPPRLPDQPPAAPEKASPAPPQP